MAEPWLTLLGWLPPPPLGAGLLARGCVCSPRGGCSLQAWTPEGRRGGTCHMGAACAVRAAVLLGCTCMGQEPVSCTPALRASSRLFPGRKHHGAPPPGSFLPCTRTPEQGCRQVSLVAQASSLN